MLTRREVLIGAIAIGAMMRVRTGLAKASQPGTPVDFEVPAGACDCHTDIHGDPEKFPFFPGRVYTPETALPEEMAALHIQRVVIVTPSVYGTDNSATLYGMRAHGADARGVAVIDDKTPESELDAMGQAGGRGIRLNLATAGVSDPSDGRRARQEPQLARPDLHEPGHDLRNQGPGRRLSRAGSVRPFRRRQGRARYATARLFRLGGAGRVGQGLRQDLRRLSRIQARAGLCRRAARQGAHCCEPQPDAIRPIALGRKNWLFTGPERAGKRATAIQSLLGTAKPNGLDPAAWLRDILEELPLWSNSRIDELLPRRRSTTVSTCDAGVVG